MTDHSATTPYDWDAYEHEFVDGPAYAAQEDALSEVFARFDDPMSVLEVGPGLGRITKMAAGMWPLATFALVDITEAAIEKASAECPDTDFSYAIGRIQDAWDWMEQFPWATRVTGKFDLVVAVEVLMHIPPKEVEHAVDNLLKGTRGYLVTCDWTVPVDGPVRVQNYLHEYEKLYAGHDFDGFGIGAQTIYVVKP